MQYLFSIKPEVVAEGGGETWAESNEPVIPSFPSIIRNVFISTVSFKPSMYAEVQQADTLDLDAMADRLKKEYPGLPEALHENYITITAGYAMRQKVGTRVRVFITPDKASVQNIITEQLYVLWTRQPMEEK